MKVFYRKELNGRVKDITFSHRLLDTEVEFTVIKAYVDDIENGIILNQSILSSMQAYTTMLKAITTKLLAYGWNEDYDIVHGNKYNTYADGTYLPSKITERIDSLENLTFPVHVHQKPKGYQDVYFAGSFRNMIGVPNKEIISLGNKIQNVLCSPFNCYIRDNEIIVYDIMMLETPYRIRCNLFTELEGTVKTIEPIKINSVKELKEYCENKKDIIIIGNENEYVPSFSMSYAYIYSSEVYDEGIVISITDNIITCIDISFENIITLKKEEGLNPKISDIVKYEKLKSRV